MKRRSEFAANLLLLPVLPIFAALLLSLSPLSADAFTDAEISKAQAELRDRPLGERIAFWAEKFVGRPYDPDPLGEYVTKAAVVADERVDCMYLTFRTVELALSNTPGEAVGIALDKRFHGRGVLSEDKVVNYGDRFEYGEDMLYSGKWGREITLETGRTSMVRGSRGRETVAYLPGRELVNNIPKLRSGDILFFVKAPGKRQGAEIIGHMGIIKIDREAPVSGRNDNLSGRKTGPDMVYLIHASGIKGKGGVVKKVLLKDYVLRMPFPGAKITRFD